MNSKLGKEVNKLSAKNLMEKTTKSGVSRRQFILWAGAMGLTLPTISTLLASCTSETSTKRKLGKVETVASDYMEAFELWNDEVAKGGRTEDLTLTPDEEAKVKAMGLRIGSTWMSLSSFAPRYTSEGAERRCKELGIEPIVVSNGGSLERELVTARMFINEKVDAVIGYASKNFGWGEAVESLYDAGIPMFAPYRPHYSYYPTVCVVGGDAYRSGADAAPVIAKKIADAGFNEAKVAQISAPVSETSCW
jgi:hypothetical protein